MTIKYRFAIFFANINQAFFTLIMVGRNGSNLPASAADKIAAMGYMEMNSIVNGMRFEAVNQDVLIKSFLTASLP